jgi:hypothetical protein
MSPTLLLGLIAAVGPAPPVVVTGDCPSAEAVTAALGSALGSEAPRAGDPPRVTDHGDRFSVAALGQTREYADPARDCDERARAAAVFIALALNPPIAPAAAPPVVAAPAAAPAPPPERWIDLAAAARLDGGAAPETRAAFGVEARVALGWNALGVVASAGVLAPTESRLSTVTIRQQRFPLAVALTVRRALSQRIVVAGVAGAALVPLTVRGEALDGASQATRLDAGVRLAVELRIRTTQRLAPFVDLHAEIFPRAYQLDVEPLGTVASTGRFWAGAAVGLAFDAGPARASP